MELTKGLEYAIAIIKLSDNIDSTNWKKPVVIVLQYLSELCESAGETQWSVKDQIDLAIEELKY